MDVHAEVIAQIEEILDRSGLNAADRTKLGVLVARLTGPVDYSALNLARMKLVLAAGGNKLGLYLDRRRRALCHGLTGAGVVEAHDDGVLATVGVPSIRWPFKGVSFEEGREITDTLVRLGWGK